jgi:UDP-glucuronate 4-epimerase
MKILVTGCAGFIGMHTCLKLLERGDEVVGIDNINNYYDVNLKANRLALLNEYDNFSFVKLDISDVVGMKNLFQRLEIQAVVHLAAQAGVRYSISNPLSFVQSNVVGFVNILECCKHHNINHVVFASSSSVYGSNTNMPFSVNQNVDHPVSLYAATKKSGELVAHSYSHLFNLPVTCLRFFTVYGPWGRPDMSPFIFTKAILEGRPIDVFNYGNMQRDFTFIDDIVEGVVRVLDSPASSNILYDTKYPDPSTSFAPYAIYNIGSHRPVNIIEFINNIERSLGKKAAINMLPMQAGDVVATYAETSVFRDKFGYEPTTPLRTGIEKFIDWYLKYFNYKNITRV